MGLLSSFKRKAADSESHAADEPAGDAVQTARTRARRRLVGAVVLLLIGIIGFPIVFETQPRPIPLDIPIEIPRKDAVPPLVMPAPRNAGQAADAASEDGVAAGHSAAAPEAAQAPEGAQKRAAAAETERAPAAVVSKKPDASPAAPSTQPPQVATAAKRPAEAAKPETAKAADAARPIETAKAAPEAAKKSETAAAAKKPNAPADAARARALLAGNGQAASDGARFVVQVGAFADAGAAREVRQRVEKLGLKTYTQVAQTASGNRIRVRVGPFATRDEADRALAKARDAGLSAVVLTL